MSGKRHVSAIRAMVSPTRARARWICILRETPQLRTVRLERRRSSVFSLVPRRDRTFEHNFNFVDGTVDDIIDGKIANPRVIPAILHTRLARHFTCRCKWRDYQTDDSNRVIIFATNKKDRQVNLVNVKHGASFVGRILHLHSEVPARKFVDWNSIVSPFSSSTCRRRHRTRCGRSNGNASVSVAKRH